MANGWKTFGIIVIALAVLSLVACGFCGILGSSSDEPVDDVNQGGNTPVVNDKEETPTVKPTESTTQTQTPTSTATFGEKQALDEAKSYLRIMSFSYEGLIDQLEYEGYSHTEAVYGAKNCGANWNEQALKSAKSYLKTYAFSYEGLIDQLEYEKFTPEQAKYGADNCGADWYEQAVKSAESYLDLMSFSYSELVDQLEFEGFTPDQAQHGASQAYN